MTKKYKIGVIGAGNMGMAIVNGACAGNLYKKSEILLFNRSEEKRKEREDLGYAVTDDYIKIYTDCEMVIISAKPQNYSEIMENLKKHNLDKKPLIISIAAGISLKYIEEYLGSECQIIRIMPNTPLMLGCGASALAKNNACSQENLNKILEIFDSLGVTVVFDNENAINNIIPANGSAPAYVYYFIDSMVKNAEKHGIDRQAAIKLVCKTFEGSAKMVMESGKNPEKLIEEVCSPGGTTIEAIKVLKDNRVDKIIDDAGDKCIKRAYELGK